MSKELFWALLTALLVTAAGGAYAYTQQPERVISDAVQKLSKASSAHFEAQVTLDNPAAAPAILKNAGTLTVNLNGSFDRRGEKRDSLAANMVVNAQTEGVVVELEGEVRFIEDKVYLLVKKSPAAIPALAKLKDQWIEFPRGPATSAAAPAGEGPLFSRVKRLGRESIKGTSTVKYDTTATARAIVGFMDRIAQLLGTRLTDEQVTTIRGNLADIKELPVTLWIAPITHELVQLETRLGDSGTRYTIMFSDRNRPVNHIAPESAKSIQAAVTPP